MPIYEYECIRCGHLTETWQKFSDPPISKCELCQGKMRKLISHNNFHLKGTGWYVTDYASKSGSAAPDKKQAPEKSETKSTGSDSKSPAETPKIKESSGESKSST
jgi:putative FmdB family regulatory protein